MNRPIKVKCPDYELGVCVRCHSNGLLTRPYPMGQAEDGQILYAASCPCGTELFTNLKAESDETNEE